MFFVVVVVAIFFFVIFLKEKLGNKEKKKKKRFFKVEFMFLINSLLDLYIFILYIGKARGNVSPLVSLATFSVPEHFKFKLQPQSSNDVWNGFWKQG